MCHWAMHRQLASRRMDDADVERALTLAERALDDVAKALVEHSLEAATARKRSDLGTLDGDEMHSRRRRVVESCARRLDACDGYVNALFDALCRRKASGGTTARAEAARARARDARRDVDALARGELLSYSALPSARACGRERGGKESVDARSAVADAARAIAGTLGLDGWLATSERDAEGAGRGASASASAPRYSKAQRAREAHSGVETRGCRGGGVDASTTRTPEFSGDAATRGTWFAGAAESLARADIAIVERYEPPVAPREAETERDALLDRRTETAPGGASASASGARRADDVSSANAAERDRRSDAMCGTARLDASSDVLARCADVLENTESVGADVLAALAAQRESLVRAGTAARGASRNMDENLRIVKGMNSWTRLGR